MKNKNKNGKTVTPFSQEKLPESDVLESSIKENPNQVETSHMGLECWAPKEKEAIRMLGVVKGCCLDTTEGMISSTTTALRAANNEENEAFPCECVDSDAVDHNPSGSISVVGFREQREDGVMGFTDDHEVTIKSNEGVGISSNTESSGEMYSFSSPLNGAFDDSEWLNWDWVGGGLQCHNDDLELWDEGEVRIPWLWESGNNVGDQI